MGILIFFPPRPSPPAPAEHGSQVAAQKPDNTPATEVLDFKPKPGSPTQRLDWSPFQRVLGRGWESVKSSFRSRSISFWTRSAQALLLAIAVCFSMGASNAGSRVQSLDHHLMCTCGCAELLGECNHVGCTDSTQELSELRTDIVNGMTDKEIFNAFVGKYGATVLAAPPTRGFDLVAWIAPFAVFLAALLGTILLIRRWGGLRGFHPQQAGTDDQSQLDPAERARMERIRRETDPGFDGGVTR
jgi:cytochrome c-type biogenesis protein CcmH/NrfF